MTRIYILIALSLCWLIVSVQTFTLKNNVPGGQATIKQVLNGFGWIGENKSPPLY